MKSTKIIAISGFKNSGKDTAAIMLQYLMNSPKFMHHYWMYKIFRKFFSNGQYKIASFASPLKKMLSALLNVPVSLFNDRDFKENYYIYFPTLQITNKLPIEATTISDNKFSKTLANKDLSFLSNTWITIRQLLQVFGTECMRGTFGDRLWVLATLRNTNPIIISDLRFEVELQEIKDNKGITIYIDRPGCKPGNHASEKEIFKMAESSEYDYYIDNKSTLESLFNKLKRICRFL